MLRGFELYPRWVPLHVQDWWASDIIRSWNDCELLTFFIHPKITATLKVPFCLLNSKEMGAVTFGILQYLAFTDNFCSWRNVTDYLITLFWSSIIPPYVLCRELICFLGHDRHPCHHQPLTNFMMDFLITNNSGSAPNFDATYDGVLLPFLILTSRI